MYVQLDELKCPICGKLPDGAMLILGDVTAHVPCVIKRLNKLLDMDYDGTSSPRQTIAWLDPDQTLPANPYDGDIDIWQNIRLAKRTGFTAGQQSMIKGNWRKVKHE